MKRGRLRTVGRWGVWVFTALVLISVPVSFWAEPEVMVVYYHEAGSQKSMYGVWLVDGRLRVARDPVYQPNFLDSRSLETSWANRVTVEPGFNTGQIHYRVSWWAAPTRQVPSWIFGSRPQALDLPIVYPTVLLIAWSWWLVTRRRQLAAGCCVGCGYSLAGLDGGVCPECGEKIEK